MTSGRGYGSIMSKGGTSKAPNDTKPLFCGPKARMRWTPKRGREALIFEIIQRNKMTEVLLR